MKMSKTFVRDAIEAAADIGDTVLDESRSLFSEGQEEDQLRTKDRPNSGEAEFALFHTDNFFGTFNLKTKNIGSRPRKKNDFLDGPQIHLEPDVKTYQHTLPLIVGGFNNVTLPLGLTIISGPTAIGKSSLLRALPNVARLLAVEPPDSLAELSKIPIYNSADEALMNGVKIALSSDMLPAIDSLRAPLFEINGPAGKNGVIMPFFTALTRVSNTLAAHGITMLATVNPMLEDEDYVQAFLSKISSAVPCFIRVNTANFRGGNVDFSGTIADRKHRTPVSFVYSGESKSTKSEAVKPTQVSFSAPDPAKVLTTLLGPMQLNKLNDAL
jgi:hypothetical protein